MSHSFKCSRFAFSITTNITERGFCCSKKVYEMNRILNPRESGEFIARESIHVTILKPGIKELAKRILTHLQDGTLHLSRFSQWEVHPKVADEKAINWIFVVDTLNFCFWSSQNKKWHVTWRGKSYTGYFALCAAVNRAQDEGYPITDPTYYSKITLQDLKWIFRGDDESVEIPLLKERENCLHEAGQILLQKFDGSFVNCIKACNNSVETLLHIITENFNCYKDEVMFKSMKVSFYKRAQILIGDIWVCYKGKGLGLFKDIKKLTMFADYRVPQVLVYFNTMRYSENLLDKLKKGEILEYGCEEEIEIRGCSIYAVECLLNEIKALMPDIKDREDEENETGSMICNSILIDHFLWDYRREYAKELEKIPFHKTLSIFY